MARVLTSVIQNQLSSADVKAQFIFKLNSVDYTDYLISSQLEYSKEFGSASATFTLNNNNGLFGEGGANKIEVGDVVEFSEKFRGDVTEFKRFYGIVNQRSITKSADTRQIALVCLDYISVLQFLDIDLVVEGTKVEITEETLTPNYLVSPNDNLAQLFDFANDSLADNPLPVILIKNKGTAEEDPQSDGFEIYYDVGQMKLGYPLNAKYNYDVIARSYYCYTKGKYAEDILEEIFTEPDGYGVYLFGETSAADVITNHLTETFLNVEAKSEDVMIPNYTSSTIVIDTTLTSAVIAGATSIAVTSTTGFPASGTGSINGDTFSWSSKDTTHLYGIPATGSYSLNAHSNGSYVEYSASYSAGQVWYLTYSNLITNLTSGDFTIPGGTFNYLDKRLGRIILVAPISTATVVTCNSNYSFKTLQATEVELNKISFRSRELQNRLEAINKLRKYLAPNYIIRTIGDNKIWASYLYQKTTEDYTLQLPTGINYLEDEDLYTRVIFWAKNKNPTNLMFSSGVDFVTTAESYKGTASNSEITLLREEGNYYVYGMLISGVGKITANTVKPIVYINSVPIDNKSHVITGQEIVIETTTKTETTQEGGGK